MPDILVLDDSPLLLSIVARSLRDEGMTVNEAASAAQAVSLLRQAVAAPLLVTDYDLGEAMNGADVARIARGLFGDIGIIFMTGLPDNLRNHTLDRQTRLLPKPFLPSRLIAMIHEVAGTA